MLKQKIFILLFCIVSAGQIFAQTDIKDEKNPEISDELKGKASNLLNTLAREAEQFQLPENRISARTSVANLLWKSDEKQARSLFQSAVTETESLIDGIILMQGDSTDEIYLQIYNVSQLRRDLLLNIAAHDPVFALSAFQSLSRKKEDGTPLFDGDEIFELELAKQIAENNPKSAYDVAVKNLENGLGYGVFETLENIYNKDADLGAKLAREILGKIKNKGSETVSIVNNSSNTNSAKPSATPSPNAATGIVVYQIREFVDKINKLKRQKTKDKKTPVLTDAEYKELIEILARKYSTQEYLAAYEVSGVITEIDALYPALAQAIRRKLANERANLEKMSRERAFEIEMEDKSVEEIIGMIEKKPIAQRDELYNKAAEIVYNEGDILSAKTLYDKSKTKPEYDYLGDVIKQGTPLALAEDGNLSEVLKMMDQVKTPEEKIEIFTALSQSLAAKGDLKGAKQLADEARTLYLGKMKNRRNMVSIIQLSSAYAVVDPEQGFSFLENNISFINDLIAAGIVIDEFNETGSVKNDEVLLTAVQAASYSNLPKGVALIKKLAKADFERTVSFAERFTRNEARFFARFRLAQALLDPKAEEIESANQQTYEGEGC